MEIQGSIDFSGNLIMPTEAGEDFSQSLDGTQEIFLSVIDNDDLGKQNNNNKFWTVSISLNFKLAGNTVIEAKRTGRGSYRDSPANPNIHDGDIFRPLTSVETYFFKGKGEIINIPVSFKLSGISVLTGGDLSSQTEVILTISEGWK